MNNWWPVTDEEWEILNGFRSIPTPKKTPTQQEEEKEVMFLINTLFFVNIVAPLTLCLVDEFVNFKKQGN